MILYDNKYGFLAVHPGGHCLYSAQCEKVVNGSQCSLERCICPANLPVPADGTCTQNCPQSTTFSSVTGSCLPSWLNN